MKLSIAIIALFLSSCSTLIEKAMDADWLKYQHMMKNHPNPSGYPNQKAPTP